jgi:hypothetical protein
MPKVHRFDIWIENYSDGKRLKEYKVITNGNTAECFIESMVDERFRVRARLAENSELPEPYNFGTSVYVDGQWTAGQLMGEIKTKPRKYERDLSFVGAATSSGSFCPYVFGATQFTGFNTHIEMS